MNKKTFLGTLLFTASLLLTSCSLPLGSFNRISRNSNGSIVVEEDNYLKLLYFGESRFDNNNLNLDYVKEEGKKEKTYMSDFSYQDNYYGGCDLTAYILNPDHLSFLDVMVAFDSASNKYIYKDGNGDYRVDVSTFYSNDVWITNIRFWADGMMLKKNTNTCYYDAFVQIEEINFLSTTGATTKVNIKDVSTSVDIRFVSNREEDHYWSSWSYSPATCLEYGGQYRTCYDCKKEESQINDNERPLGHACGGYGIRNKEPGVIQMGDEFFGNHACSRCGEYINDILPTMNLELEWIIDEEIVTIGRYAFQGSLGLRMVGFPETIQTIEDGAFSCCPNLKTVYFNSVGPPNIGSDLFGSTWDADDFVIYVPREGLSAYKNYNDSLWREYAVRHIQAYD